MSNTKNSNGNLDDEIEAFDKEEKEKEKRKKEFLLRMLDSINEKKKHFVAVSAKMGSSDSYISSVSLEWFTEVHFAADMNIFEDNQDEQIKSVKINKETLDYLSQRQPDWRRQIAMTTYLSVREHHKFPPVLLVAYQDWMFDPNSEKWGADKRALENSITCESLGSGSWIVDFNHDKTDFYALDGQHRLMAVRGLNDLFKNEVLHQKDKSGAIRKKSVTIENIFEYVLEGATDLKEFKKKLGRILDEKIGVEIIPAVQKGETLQEAFARLRQIFVDVNQNAKRLEKGELALLDETNGFSIVARDVMVSASLFYNNEKELRVNSKDVNLDENSKDYTTLQAIVGMAREYLGVLHPFNRWEEPVCNIKEAGLLRPSYEDLEKGRKKLTAYFEAIKELPSHKRMIQGTEIGKIRRRKRKDVDDMEGEDNILFRPIAQEALAKAVGLLERNGGMTLEDIIKKLSKKDNPDDPNLKLTEFASPFFGILCDPVSPQLYADRRNTRV